MRSPHPRWDRDSAGAVQRARKVLNQFVKGGEGALLAQAHQLGPILERHRMGQISDDQAKQEIDRLLAPQEQ